MNKGEFESQWKQVRSQAKEVWGKLTDDDLEKVGGKFDKFINLLQEKYGYTRTHAKKEFDNRMAEYEAGHKQTSIATH